MRMTGEPLALTSEVAGALAAEGFRFAIDAPTSADDTDEHAHLGDATVARLFDESTIAYAVHRLGSRWSEYLEAGGMVVVARELHLFHETPGRPGAHHVAGTRVAARRGKACVIEHRLVAAEDRRLVACGELVQLLVAAGRVVDWPEWYWDLVAAAEGHSIPNQSPDRRPWGPPT